MKMLRSVILALGFSLISISTLPAQQNVKLYAFANPLAGPLKFADHTWVTDYQERPKCPEPAANYWYSTGACHPSESDKDPRPLSSADADLDIAKCIAKPNESTFDPGPATARITYGIDGVCHQIANRILAATSGNGGSPITVEDAGGYRVSRFVYGEYGAISQWEALRTECKVAPMPIYYASDDIAIMTEEAGLQDKISIIQEEQKLLRAQVKEIGRQAISRSLASAEVADQINQRVNNTLRRLEESLGAEGFKRLFKWTAGDEIVLVNPQVATEIEYGRE